MKYRIKHVELIGYFAQVKLHWFSGWETIGAHMNNQTGEYSEDHLGHPLDQEWKAVELAHKHATFNSSKKGFTSYRDFML